MLIVSVLLKIIFIEVESGPRPVLVVIWLDIILQDRFLPPIKIIYIVFGVVVWSRLCKVIYVLIDHTVLLITHLRIYNRYVILQVWMIAVNQLEIPCGTYSG